MKMIIKLIVLRTVFKKEQAHFRLRQLGVWTQSINENQEVNHSEGNWKMP